MAIKLGDIARTLARKGLEGVKATPRVALKGVKASPKVAYNVGKYSGIFDAFGFWFGQGRDRVIGASMYAPLPLTKIHDGDPIKYIEEGRKHGLVYVPIEVLVDAPIGGNHLSYKRLISQAVAREVPKAVKGATVNDVAAVFVTDSYKGRRGNQSYEAVALVPKAAAAPSYRAAYPGPMIKAP